MDIFRFLPSLDPFKRDDLSRGCRKNVQGGHKNCLEFSHHPAKATYYPVVEPIDTLARIGYHLYINGRSGVSQVAPRQFRRDSPHALVFGLLWLAGRNILYNASSYDSGTSSFDDEEGDGITVVLSNHTRDNDPFNWLRWDKARVKRYRNAYFVKASDPYEIFSELKLLTLKHGPISRLEYLVHGGPGVLENISAAQFAKWAEEVRATGKFEVAKGK